MRASAPDLSLDTTTTDPYGVGTGWPLHPLLGPTGVRQAAASGDVARVRLLDGTAVAAPALVAGGWLAAPLGVAAWLVAPAAALLAVLAWFLCLTLARAYEPRFLYSGSAEAHRVLAAAGLLVVPVLALGWLALPAAAAVPVLLALAAAALLTLLGRSSARATRQRLNRSGRVVTRVLVVGTEGEAAALTARVRRDSHHGWQVVAAVAPPLDLTGTGPSHGVMSAAGLAARAAQARADLVLLCPSASAATSSLPDLLRTVQQDGRAVALAPPLVEAVGPRVSVEAVCGLPVLRVEAPERVGPRRAVKVVADRAVAALALLVLAPLLLLVAVVVRLDSPGPAFFRQVRTGKDGARFVMWKFRTMTQGAERARHQLEGSHDGAGPLFKLRVDPRVTRVGRLLRRSSMDELPQLFNVLRGEMSLVGPRPALPSEVDLYDGLTRRRLAVRPGLTGLWQVHGRSDLSWSESQRLDVRYVENWSLLFDTSIIARTVGVVLYGRGAY